MQPRMHHQPLPNAATMQAMSINEMMHATLRLSDILQEESELLTSMQYKDISKLQEEKMKLGTLLEAYQARLASDPSFVKNAEAKDREELLLITDDLAYAVEENFRKVAAAKAVNQRIAQAIMDVMSEQHRPGTYGRNGTATESDLTLSMNLNQKA